MWIDIRAQGSGQRADLDVLPTLLVVLCAGSMCGTLLLYFPTQGGICPGANPVARHPRSQRLLSQQVSPRLA